MKDQLGRQDSGHSVGDRVKQFGSGSPSASSLGKVEKQFSGSNAATTDDGFTFDDDASTLSTETRSDSEEVALLADDGSASGSVYLDDTLDVESNAESKIPLDRQQLHNNPSKVNENGLVNVEDIQSILSTVTEIKIKLLDKTLTESQRSSLVQLVKMIDGVLNLVNRIPPSADDIKESDFIELKSQGQMVRVHIELYLKKEREVGNSEEISIDWLQKVITWQNILTSAIERALNTMNNLRHSGARLSLRNSVEPVIHISDREYSQLFAVCDGLTDGLDKYIIGCIQPKIDTKVNVAVFIISAMVTSPVAVSMYKHISGKLVLSTLAVPHIAVPAILSAIILYGLYRLQLYCISRYQLKKRKREIEEDIESRALGLKVFNTVQNDIIKGLVNDVKKQEEEISQLRESQNLTEDQSVAEYKSPEVRGSRRRSVGAHIRNASSIALSPGAS